MSSLGIGLIAVGLISVCVFLWFHYQRKPRCIHTFEGHENIVCTVAFSPDGKLLASGSGDNTIKIWNVDKRECIHTFEGHKGSVCSVAFSPDGKRVVSGSKTIKLWDVDTRECIHTFKGHKSSVYTVAFSPDGKLLASGSGDNTIKLWNVIKFKIS